MFSVYPNGPNSLSLFGGEWTFQPDTSDFISGETCDFLVLSLVLKWAKVVFGITCDSFSDGVRSV